jgi:peptidylprolyl isomerase
VIIELAPEFAPNHVADIKRLARAGFFNGASVLRVQDNYVAQWGRPEGDVSPVMAQKHTLPAEFDRPIVKDLPFTRLPDPDTYAPQVGFSDGFPAARDGKQTWLTHCYGMVGAGRDNAPDSGGGFELYAVIGQSPRHLDRNITLVGRVVQGMERLSALPRGTGNLGFYKTAAERTPIRSVRVAADVPEAERVPLEALRTDSATFATLVELRRNRRDAWFVRPAGKIDLCNVPLPVRLRGG